MKQRSIPAQITTVEDRIAGNLNLTQIVLLMIPVFNLMVVYAILPYAMQLSLYKLPVIVIVTICSVALSLRVKGKVILNWLIILLKYNTRPTYYLFNKNESYLRDIALPVFKKHQRKLFQRVKVAEIKKANPTLPFADSALLEDFVSSPQVSFSVKAGRKGGLNVAIKQK